mmetsp:Transcript_11675/g.15424  ORF Transcript_11675/g.15424 Transcript_11675/m.15424 type:complete len:474 (-) Transcript_11675:311-1732(-)
MKSLVLALLLGSAYASVHQDALLDIVPRRARGGKLWQKRLQAAQADAVFTNSTANVFMQLVDHTASTTFGQRWYQDQSYCIDLTTCPIFMYIGGEGTLSATPGGYTAELAEAHGALILALEHRWYGESLPGDISTSLLDGGDYISHTVENALADLAYFMTSQETALGGGHKRTWLMVGGSYPGALSAWFRQKHPELATASWSSSGVIQAVENFTRFDEVEAAAVGEACANQLRNVTAAFEAAWDAGGAQKQTLLDLFNAPTDLTKGDMAWMLADSAAMGPQYGAKAELCSYLVDPVPNDILAAFAQWTTDHYGESFGSSCYYSTACLSDPDRVDEWYDTKSWIWQCCHELEYWQVSYEGSLRSSSLDYAYFEKQCSVAFGSGYPTADVAAFNANYGGLQPVTTQVVALNGGDDPWQGCTLNATLSPTYPESTALCDGCGHCGDLGTPSSDDPPELTAQRDLIKQYIGEWIATA